MKKIWIALFTLLSFSELNAQFLLGAGINGNYFISGDNGAFIVGVNPMGEYSLQDGELVLRAGFTYMLPKSYPYYTYAAPKNGSGTSQQVNVDNRTQYSCFDLAVRRFWGDGNAIEDGGGYFGGGVGMLFTTVKPKVGSYDAQNYVLEANTAPASYNLYFLKGLVGFEKPTDSGNFFFEMQLTFTVNKVKAPGSISSTGLYYPYVAYGTSTSGFLSVCVGYKFVIGKE